MNQQIQYVFNTKCTRFACICLFNFPSVFYCFQKSHLTSSMWEKPKIHRNYFKVHVSFLISGFHITSPQLLKGQPAVAACSYHTRVSESQPEAPSLFLLHVRGLWASLPCFSAINTVMGEDKMPCQRGTNSSLNTPLDHWKSADLGSNSMPQFPHLLNEHNHA